MGRNVLYVDEFTDKLNLSNQYWIPKILGFAWDSNCNMFSFNNQNLENFLTKILSTKRFLFQTVGRIFDRIGFISPSAFRIKCLILEM